MHAFDRDAVTGPIVVRRARAGERLTTLDGTDRALDADDLLITDDTGPIGLAAVMGGASTEIGDGTTAVLLEAAHWEPTGVARTARRHRLPSEAAKRFERGVDPEMTTVGAGPRGGTARRVRRRAGGRRAGRRRHPRPAAGRSRSTPAEARPGGRRAVHPRRRWSSCSPRSAATVDGDGGPLARHPAVVAPGPHRPGRPGRGGRPARRLRRHPLRAAHRAARPRADRGAAPPPRDRPRAGRGRLRRGAVLPVRRREGAGRPRPGGRRRAPPGRRRPQPAVGGGAGAADDAAARPAGDAGPQPRPRPARPGAVRARRGLPRRTAHAGAAARAWTAVRTTRRSPRCSAPCRSSRGTWPWRSPATASRAAGGARAGRPSGPTPSRPPAGSPRRPGSS